MNRIRNCLLVIAACAVGACAGEDSTPTQIGPACQLGSTQACTCPDGGTGMRPCDGATLTFGECNCTVAPDGGDAGGSGGSGGSAGKDGGTAGTAGKDGGTKDGGTKDGGTKDGGTKDGGSNEGGQGAVTCTTDADCEVPGACPDSATLGCGCRFNPQNEGHCAPLCSTDTDCASDPNKIMECTKDGFCAPQKTDGGTDGGNPPPPDGGNPPPPDGGEAGTGPVTCTADTECEVAGVCPSDALKGCACKVEDGGAGKCAPLCSVDTDCPTGKNLVCKTDGFCGPA